MFRARFISYIGLVVTSNLVLTSTNLQISFLSAMATGAALIINVDDDGSDGELGLNLRADSLPTKSTQLIYGVTEFSLAAIAYVLP